MLECVSIYQIRNNKFGLVIWDGRNGLKPHLNLCLIHSTTSFYRLCISSLSNQLYTNPSVMAKCLQIHHHSTGSFRPILVQCMRGCCSGRKCAQGTWPVSVMSSAYYSDQCWLQARLWNLQPLHTELPGACHLMPSYMALITVSRIAAILRDNDDKYC